MDDFNNGGFKEITMEELFAILRQNAERASRSTPHRGYGVDNPSLRKYAKNRVDEGYTKCPFTSCSDPECAVTVAIQEEIKRREFAPFISEVDALIKEGNRELMELLDDAIKSFFYEHDRKLAQAAYDRLLLVRFGRWLKKSATKMALVPIEFLIGLSGGPRQSKDCAKCGRLASCRHLKTWPMYFGVMVRLTFQRFTRWTRFKRWQVANLITTTADAADDSIDAIKRRFKRKTN